jgi:hypothetical protein
MVLDFWQYLELYTFLLQNNRNLLRANGCPERLGKQPHGAETFWTSELYICYTFRLLLHDQKPRNSVPMSRREK